MAFTTFLMVLQLLGLTTYLSLAWALVGLNTLALGVLFLALKRRTGWILPEHTHRLWVLGAAVFVAPSVWVWSSGVLRESLSLSGLALLLACTLSWQKRLSWVYLLLGGLLVGVLQPWLGLAATPFLLLSRLTDVLKPYFLRQPRSQRWLGGILGLILLAGVGGLIFQTASPNQKSLWAYMRDLRAWSLSKSVYHNQHHLSSSALDTTLTQTSDSQSALTQFGQNIRLVTGSIAAVYLEPWPWRVRSTLPLLMVLENLLYLLLLMGAIGLCWRRRISPNWTEHHWWAMLAFALGYGLFLGLTIPFLGSLMRYRAGPLLALIPAAVLFFQPLLESLIPSSKAKNSP